MASVEGNNEDWKELRSRVDSIANAVFLVAGGALSLSISPPVNLQRLQLAAHRENEAMASVEGNNEDWKELRSRVDSIANAVFLVAGGALSLSITVVLGNRAAPFITKQVVGLTIQAWYCLLAAVLLFLLLKVHLVLQAFLLQFTPRFVNRHIVAINLVGWVIGAFGFAAFTWGVWAMVLSAVAAVRV